MSDDKVFAGNSGLSGRIMEGFEDKYRHVRVVFIGGDDEDLTGGPESWPDRVLARVNGLETRVEP